MTEMTYTAHTLYRRVLQEARPYWTFILGKLGLSLLSTPLTLLAPLPLKIVVDSVLGDEPLPGWLQPLAPAHVVGSDRTLLAVTIGLVVVIALLTQLRVLASTVLSTYTGEKLVLDFRSRIFRHAQRLSLMHHDAKGASDSTYRIQYDAPAIQWIAIDGIIPFITSTVKLAAMIYVTSRINTQLALLALAVTPLLYLLSRTSGNRLRSEWRDVKVIDSSVMAVVQEVIGSVRVVKAFGQEDHEQRRFTDEASKSVRAKVRLSLLEGGLGLLIGLTTAAGTAAILYVGVGQVQSGVISLGDLLLVMGYLTQLYKPLETMSQKVADLQSSLSSAERAFTLLDEEPDVPEKPQARRLPRARGAVRFDDVSFGYDQDNLVLQNVSFAIKAGTRLGIAGTTGAGKTTLVSLLTRFYDPTSGRILLDGVDLRDYRLADLRNQFAIVLQEPVLFSTSIGENIAYARPGASHEDIVAAARAAHAHDFVVDLSEGYDTRVGERGMRLSGGERQRISLARAFLKDAPILILDEPTSSVDVHTEELIIDAMMTLMRERTTLMIAHRLSTLEHCDAQLVIEQGIIEYDESPNGSGPPPVMDTVGTARWVRPR